MRSVLPLKQHCGPVSSAWLLGQHRSCEPAPPTRTFVPVLPLFAEALSGWQELLGGCDLVFVHAPSSNWQQLFGGEQPLLDRADPRVRWVGGCVSLRASDLYIGVVASGVGASPSPVASYERVSRVSLPRCRRVPFTTRRPTFSETKRIMRILVTLYQLPAASDVPAGSAVPQGTAAADAAVQQPQRSPAAAAAAAHAAAAAAAAEEEARRKKAEKRARQKAKQKEQRQAEAAASRAAAEEAARQAADDEIGRAAAQVSAMSGRLTAKPAPVSSGAAGQASAPPPRLSAKPRANEGADVRRARLAAAAEARMKAIQEAAKQQLLH